MFTGPIGMVSGGLGGIERGQHAVKRYRDGRRRNAGETKGVTMEMNKKQLAELKQLLDQPQNRYCADCTGGGAAARASWASINTGVFLCMRCAGVHRGLGTHISKVAHWLSLHKAQPQALHKHLHGTSAV